MSRSETKPLCCPTCGAPQLDRVIVGGKKRQALFDFLWERKHGATTQQVISHLYDNEANGGPEDAQKCVHVVVHQINETLEDLNFPWRISSVSGRYKFVAPDEMFRRYTIPEKRKIAREPGGVRALARRYKVTHNTIHNWRRQFANGASA